MGQICSASCAAHPTAAALALQHACSDERPSISTRGFASRYDNLQKMAVYLPAETNRHGSYLTGWSNGGLVGFCCCAAMTELTSCIC